MALIVNCACSIHRSPTSIIHSPVPITPSSFLKRPATTQIRTLPPTTSFGSSFGPTIRTGRTRTRAGIIFGFLPVDPWSPNIDSQSIASQLFAVSLFPYLGFLYFITKSKAAPKLTLFGFYFLLAFVGATSGPLAAQQSISGYSAGVVKDGVLWEDDAQLVKLHFAFAAWCSLFAVPAGIYAKVHYGTSLSNVDWLHGGAESLLTLSNLFVVLGLRKALRESKDLKENQSDAIAGFKEENPSL
ncbi:hypothetical protein Cgig2_026958 [Carnegiea gigantea]|uniref:Uncharacterized protein n=1 Tax=Carnegiea gigantea TaxID=171969 RepID=A0A9Q1KYD1_9CARY|nr:hypothetical protein Cgig2_026958 [Carnegiea gigantea]